MTARIGLNRHLVTGLVHATAPSLFHSVALSLGLPLEKVAGLRAGLAAPAIFSVVSALFSSPLRSISLSVDYRGVVKKARSRCNAGQPPATGVPRPTLLSLGPPLSLWWLVAHGARVWEPPCSRAWRRRRRGLWPPFGFFSFVLKCYYKKIPDLKFVNVQSSLGLKRPKIGVLTKFGKR